MSVTIVASGGNVGVATTSSSATVTASTNVDLGTWARLVELVGRGYNYPQPTGQTTVYRTGDDADIESTIFTAAVRAANSLKAQNSLASFLVLNNTNSFGNTIRFTDEFGTEVFANNYMVDNYTGLGWDLTLATRSWANGIDDGLASSFNGFNDWFLPNFNQLSSIKDFNASDSVGIYKYVVSISLGAWASTTSISTSSTFAILAFTLYRLITNLKTTAANTFFCRKHF